MSKQLHIIKAYLGAEILIVTACVLLLGLIPLFGLAQSSDTYPVLSVSVTVSKTRALPGDEITYTITYRNIGDGPATGIVIKNPFTETNQNYLEFISANPIPDSGNSTWIIDGPLNYNESGKITINARIKSTLPSNWLTIRDRASIDSNETNARYSNYASIFVISNCRLKINQSVRNVSENSLFGDSVSADSGDEVEFLLEIEVVGTNQAANTKIWDRLSSRLKYVSGSAIIDGSSLGNEFLENGVYIGDLLVGAKKTVKFRATVDSSASFYVGNNFLRSYGYVDADICMAKSSIATVLVKKESRSNLVIVGSSSGLTITKYARNLSQKRTSWSTGTIYANPGDEIEFLIKIKSGSEDDVSVRVEDVLPPKMYYISDSTTVDGNYEPDGITTKNVYLAHVYKNLTKEVKFKVKMAGENEFNLYPISLVNRASVWGNDGKEISDTVKIIVNQPTAQSSIKNVGISSGTGTTQSGSQNSAITDNSGEVKGAATVKTGFNHFKFLLIFLISVVITFILYFVAREDKLLEILNKGKTGKFRKSIIGFYFKAKLLFRLKLERLRKR